MDKLTKIRVAGIPDGFQELRFAHADIVLTYVAGSDNGLPLSGLSSREPIKQVSPWSREIQPDPGSRSWKHEIRG